MDEAPRKRVPVRTFIVLAAVIVGILLIGLYIWSQAVYAVDDTQQVIVLRFGEVEAVRDEPGQYTKSPMIDTLVYYTKEPVRVEAPVARFLDRDRGMPEINLFLHYRITDPVRFLRTLQNEINAESRLGDIALATLRDELARRSRSEILTDPRVDAGTPVEISEQVIESTRDSMEQRLSGLTLGIEIVDLAATATYHSN